MSGVRTCSSMIPHKQSDAAEAQAGKRQRTAAGTARPPLASVPPPEVFAGREDVDAAEAQAGKWQSDATRTARQSLASTPPPAEAQSSWAIGKIELQQLMDGIGKKSALCDSYDKRNSEIAAGINKLDNSIEQVKSKHEELKKQYAHLQQHLKMVEVEKKDAIRALQEEKKARTAVESSNDGFLEDLKKSKLQEQHLNENIKMLQDRNTSLLKELEDLKKSKLQKQHLNENIKMLRDRTQAY